MLSINSQSNQSIYNFNKNILFKGKTETFWKAYKLANKDVFLNEAIEKSISDKANILGEGFDKIGYNFAGLKDYVIRVYKRTFNKEDLITKQFQKPVKNYLNDVNEVVLCIPEKIDIVKKKLGLELGVDGYAIKMAPPMENVVITRDETMRVYDIYQQLQTFPVKSFKSAYLRMKQFNREPGYQFDILSPTNILIDTNKKKINLIDPMDPKLNKCEDSYLDFSGYHGTDSLYPVLCDFIMHKYHLDNLSSTEQERWKKAVRTIISKCITAGTELGFSRNIDKLNKLYDRVNRVWDGKNSVPSRYHYFLELYSGIINQSETISKALNHRNSENERINSIKQLDTHDFKILKPVFEEIIRAPHQPKVEIPEVLNAALDKIYEYGKDAKCMYPTLEELFNKEIFYPTKQRLYNMFIEFAPDNQRFLVELAKTANNKFEKSLYKQEIEMLYNKSFKMPKSVKALIKSIYNDSISGESVPEDITKKLWMSRTCTNTTEAQEISLENMYKAYDYIQKANGREPNVNDLVKLHQIVLDKTPDQDNIIGVIRTAEKDFLFFKTFNVKALPKNAVNPYAESADVKDELKKFDKFIKDNYDTMDTFKLAAYIFSEIIRIHPFYNGNGRVSRLFTEQFLLSKGYNLEKWPEEALYRKVCSVDEVAEKLRQNSKANIN